jgi:hypothetical protein
MEERLKELKYDKIKNEYTMKVKTWNNGKHNKSGSGYGVKINRSDRDKYFSREWKSITLCVGTQNLEVQLSDTFWTTCSEFRSKVIGEYLIENGLETWTKGKPNELKLEVIGDRFFKLST